MRLVDLHSHILPDIDDGAKDTETSINMLNIYKTQGITDVFATPHFIPMEISLEEFLEQRNNSYNLLLSKIDVADSLPKIHLGAEIYYFKGIGQSEDIAKLKLEGTNYILIELPMDEISKYMINDILQIRNTTGLTPIIAHVERYGFQKGYKNLLKIFASNDALMQVNASSLLFKPFNKITKKLLKTGLVAFIASDAHSDTLRPPIIENSLRFIKDKYDCATFNKIRENISGLFFENEVN